MVNVTMADPIFTCFLLVFTPICIDSFLGLEVLHMTVKEQIMQHVNTLPETAQSEVLDFVEYLESKSAKANWSEFSLSQAMRGIESEATLYSLNDIKK
jgi:hypothetical protein